jgi:hypothetical protein
MRYLIAPLLAILGGCTLTPAQQAAVARSDAVAQQDLAKELAGLEPGKPVSCLANYRARQLKGFGSTLVYVEGRNLKYRVEAPGCEGVARGDILVTVSPTGQLCSGDLARTVSQTSRIPSGGCGLGEFTPYRRPRS